MSVAASSNNVGAPSSSTEWLRLGAILGQLGLILVALRTYQVESQAFASLSNLIALGFVIHAIIPFRFRLPLFAMLSLGGIALVLGAYNSVWLIGLGLGVITLCCLPIPFLAQILLLLMAAGVLTAMRSGWLAAPWSSVIWPVFGSMFMFRTMMFLYDRRHGERPRSVWETLSYFFLLPNVCFPLFPLVDYATFRRTYYGENVWDCYQTGIRWIVRGLLHLVIYRLLYYHGLLAPAEVASAGDLARYMGTTISLYLRVSGVFHIAIGILRLFGFALPETHFLYFLCASINDFWRRANIYWKDFMLKLFYLPAFFRLRKIGPAFAFVISTLLVVIATWALHSYQWFWLRGAFPIKWQDGVFWTTLGVLMVVNTLYEQRQSRARGRRARVWNAQTFFGHSARIITTFVFLSVLWSLWTCESLSAWLNMWSLPGRGAPQDGKTPFTAFATVFAVLSGLCLIEAAAGKPGASVAAGRPFLRSVGLTSATLVGLLVLGQPSVYRSIGDRFGEIVQDLRIAKLNRLDTESLQRGYYEDLLDVDRFNSELWRVYKSKPTNWLELRNTVALQPTHDFQLTELAPSTSTTYKGAPFVVNRWGMRDRDYPRKKPEGTFRIGMFGGSYVMGSGVDDDRTFEALIEARLSKEGPGAPDRGYEVLNFAVGGYSPMQRAGALHRKGFAFDLDLAVYVAHENETYRMIRHLVIAHKRALDIPDSRIRRILDHIGADPAMSTDAFEAALQEHLPRILRLTYSRFVTTCKKRGVRPLWVLVPTLEMRGQPGEIAWLSGIAKKAGFETIELFGLYDGHDTFSTRIADWDYHPNELGHQLIADRLYQELTTRDVLR